MQRDAAVKMHRGHVFACMIFPRQDGNASATLTPKVHLEEKKFPEETFVIKTKPIPLFVNS